MNGMRLFEGSEHLIRKAFNARFSKSFLGYAAYKMAIAAREGFLPTIARLILPSLVLCELLKLVPPWAEQKV